MIRRMATRTQNRYLEKKATISTSVTLVHHLRSSNSSKTRQLSYREEDRAMRPIYGCPEKFWESSVLTTHLATFPEICSRLLFRSILRMCAQKLKFVALPVP